MGKFPNLDLAMTNIVQNSPQHLVVTALTWILRPIVKLLIQQQITYPYLADLIKRLYLDVAMKDIPQTGARLTDSRLSLLTGVHRKDIRRLREEPELLQPVKDKSISMSAQVIATWLSDPEFCHDNGTPKTLSRLAVDGEPCFETLVESVSRQDFHSRSLFDEWLRLNVITLDDDDRVTLNVDAFGPSAGFDEKIYFFKRNLHDHLAASVHNVLGERPAHFDRCVYFNNLSTESVALLNQYAQQRTMELLKQLNQKGRLLQKKDCVKVDTKHRINFGAFFYSEPMGSTAQEEHKK